MEEKNCLSVGLSVLPIPTLISTYEKKKLSVCLLPTIDKNCDLCLPYRTIDFGAPIFFFFVRIDFDARIFFLFFFLRFSY